MPRIKRGFVEKEATKKEEAQPSLTYFALESGLPSPDGIMEEIQDMLDVLLGRVQPPINVGVATLLEVADEYYARAGELTILILRGERRGVIKKTDDYYKLRTGELREFMSIASKKAAKGSRRITDAQLHLEASVRGYSYEGSPDE